MDLKPFTQPPLVIAHRGFSADYPENTFAAFEAALHAPISGIETDVQLTKENTPVIFHDRTLRMVGGGLRRMGSQALADAQKLDFGAWKGAHHAGQSLPLLEELLRRYGRRTTWLIEIKLRFPGDRARLEQAMRLTIGIIRSFGLVDHCMILCFDLSLLAYGNQIDPQLRYVWNQDRPARFEPEALWLFAYSLHHRAVTRPLVDEIHRAGKAVMTFTVDKPAVLKKMCAMGVDAVMANDPQWLSQQLSAMRVGGK